MRRQLIAFAVKKPVMAKADTVRLNPDAAYTLDATMTAETVAAPHAVVLPYKAVAKRPVPVKATLKMARARHAVAAAR
jgi:hypothetical protein